MSIKHVFDNLLNIVIPLVCVSCGIDINKKDMYLCPACSDKLRMITRPFCQRCGVFLPDGGELCWFCRSGSIKHTDKIRSCCVYEGVAQTLVRKLKFHNRDFLAELLARSMVKRYDEHFGDENIHIMVPVPMHWIKKAVRGYNQSELLCRKLSSLSGVPCGNNILKRKLGRSQVGCKRNERIENIKGKIIAQNCDPLENKNILIIDDVCTTSSTIEECARVLKKAGANRVFGYTFAHD